MPWYKIYAHHGGGHMGYTELYHWEDKPLTKEYKHDLWLEKFDDTSNATGSVVKVKGLPMDILLKRMQGCDNMVKEARKEVFEAKKRQVKVRAILEETVCLPCSHRFTSVFQIGERFLGPPINQCRYCSKIKVYGKKRWIAVPKNLERFAKRISYKR